MSSIWGDRVQLSIFGESHGNGIGVVVDGLPAGYEIDLEQAAVQMSRRAPGRDATSTMRREADAPRILSGLFNGKTSGAPLAAVIENTDTRSGDYDDIARMARPGHADYTGYIRYKGCNDPRGGGHFSGRLTAPLVFAGAVCRQILKQEGISVGGHIASIAGVKDGLFDPVGVSAAQLDSLAAVPFSLLDHTVESAMRAEVERARLDCDSVGGVVECAAVGLPAGLGSPMFGGVENVLSSILFGIPAVRGVEFGAGFNAAEMRGSQHNDPFYRREDGVIATKTNHHGGVLGGITSGMPLIVRVAFKPTASIAQPQQTVELLSGKPCELSVKGRHDPCIVPRALPVVEAAVALGLINLMDLR